MKFATWAQRHPGYFSKYTQQKSAQIGCTTGFRLQFVDLWPAWGTNSPNLLRAYAHACLNQVVTLLHLLLYNTVLVIYCASKLH